jgi:diphthamide synthase (EF-2-diphthine--ammonia ligase)
LLADMLARGIVAHLSCVDTRVLATEWVGRRLDAGTLSDLQQLAATGASMPAASRGSTTPW